MLQVYECVYDQRVLLFELDCNTHAVIPLSAVGEFVRLTNGEDINLVPPHVSALCENLNSPLAHWPVLVGSQLRNEIVEQQTARLKAAVSENNSYFSHWLKIRAFLDSLQEFDVDVKKLNNVVGKKRIRTLSSQKCVRPSFTTANTTTGRLTITSGPNFLVLPKEARKCILRRYSESTIYSIDFTSLEPRVSLWASDRAITEQDVYRNVMNMCKIEDRDVAKLATLSALYGAGVNRLAGMVDSRQLAKDILTRVSNYFGVKKLRAELDEAAANNCVKNFFGRPLYDATKNPRLRVNHFIQSTAAEMALVLFAELCAKHNGIRPLLVIHDALIVEVPKQAERDFIESCDNIVYKGFSFPTKQEILHN